jgi:hypothetical protein
MRKEEEEEVTGKGTVTPAWSGNIFRTKSEIMPGTG